MVKEQIVYIKVSDLKGNDRNPRKNDMAVDEVAKSIEKYGFRNPLIVDKNNIVWCGNTRLKASIKLGIDEVPCIVVTDLTKKKMQELALLDNKTNEVAEWDFDMLSDILPECDFDDFNLNWLDDEEVQENENSIESKRFTNVLNEEHNYIVLYFDNEVDWVQAESLFELEKVKEYSTKKGQENKTMRRQGIGRVLNGAEAINKIRGM